MTFDSWLKEQIAVEGYWFHRMALRPGLDTPGWSDPAREKLPYIGLPTRMDGMRVLDIGCAEGFFSFEAERRGAREVIAIDSFPETFAASIFAARRSAPKRPPTCATCTISSPRRSGRSTS